MYMHPTRNLEVYKENISRSLGRYTWNRTIDSTINTNFKIYRSSGRYGNNKLELCFRENEPTNK